MRADLLLKDGELVGVASEERWVLAVCSEGERGSIGDPRVCGSGRPWSLVVSARKHALRRRLTRGEAVVRECTEVLSGLISWDRDVSRSAETLHM